MKIALGTNQFFDDVGRPLVEGRVSIYKHDSDIFNEIFTLVGNDYAPAANPMILSNDGRMPTVFFEAGVVDVKVEKLVGDGIYELVDTFEAGFDMPRAQNAEFVYGMNALAEVSPDVGIVTVVGYYSDYDAPARNYVWDPYCSDVADGGVIVESNTGNEGRWILLWDDEKLPSSVYGVIPGVNESNISAFLGYADYVGSYQIRTPKFPRFLGGTYTSAGSYVTTKTLYFDKGATFQYADFQCAQAIIPENDSYVADFYFTDTKQVAHSSWFRTASVFLGCNAKNMVFDLVNYFTNAQITYERGLTNVHIQACTRLPITYANTGKLRLDGCTIDGVGIFDSSDIITFAHTEFRQEWFSTSSSSWDFVNKVIVRSSSMNRILLANFTDPSVYVKAMEADGKHEIDMAGRTMTSFSSSYISTIHNLVCTGTLSISRPTDNVVLDNVDCQSVNISCLHLNVYNSKIKFWPEPSCTAIFGQYSDISSQYAFVDPTIQISMYNCKFGVALNRATDNATRDSVIVLQDCLCYDNLSIQSKNLVMQGCTTNNAIIKIYPYYTSGTYYITFVLRDNVFNNVAPIEITKVDQDECYECIANWVVQGNTFLGNDEGLRCRYWSNRTGSYFDKIFIVTDTRSVITYNGNCGNCPAESAKGWALPTGEPYDDTVDIGSGNYVYLYWYSAGRAMPKFTQLESASLAERLYRLVCHAPSTTLFLDTNDGNRFKLQNGAFYWQTARAFNDRDGDFFQLGFALWINPLDSHDAIMVV